jgi:hypothetical protein
MHQLFRAAASAATAASAAFAVTLACAPLAGTAHAATPVYESASFVDESVSNGDYYVDDSRFLGAVFSIGVGEQLSAIGGNFTQYSDGSLFGAIVPLAPGAALPGDVASTAVAHTVFTPNGGDQTVSISGLLAPGTYALIFGAGLFGATGSSGLVSGQTALGTPSFVQVDGSGASAFTDDTLRFVVLATPVPEPATAALWAAGALLLGLASRRRSA